MATSQRHTRTQIVTRIGGFNYTWTIINGESTPRWREYPHMAIWREQSHMAGAIKIGGRHTQSPRHISIVGSFVMMRPDSPETRHFRFRHPGSARPGHVRMLPLRCRSRTRSIRELHKECVVHTRPVVVFIHAVRMLKRGGRPTGQNIATRRFAVDIRHWK